MPGHVSCRKTHRRGGESRIPGPGSPPTGLCLFPNLQNGVLALDVPEIPSCRDSDSRKTGSLVEGGPCTFPKPQLWGGSQGSS